MENRRKFYGLNRYGKPVRVISNWSGDTISKRLERIEGVLNAWKSGFVDDEDLKFILKNALVSKIFISVKAKNHLISLSSSLGYLSGLFSTLISSKIAGTPYHGLDLQDTKPKLHSGYFDICKLGDRGLNVRIEHVIPAAVYIDAKKIRRDSLMNSYDCGTLKSDFRSIFEKISICIVTKDEAEKLDRAGYRDNMPSYVSDFRLDPFARYNDSKVMIEIW